MRHQRARIVAVVAVASVLAAAVVWVGASSAAQRHLAAKSVPSTVACATSMGSPQLNAIAYRPSLGHAAALVETGFPDTPATTVLVGVQTDKSSYTVDDGCGRMKKSIRFTHHGLRSAGVVKAGYNQSPEVYCAAPNRVFVRYRIGFASSGRPATATMAVWARRKKSSRLHEIGYVRWSRSRSTSYYSTRSCTSKEY